MRYYLLAKNRELFKRDSKYSNFNQEIITDPIPILNLNMAHIPDLASFLEIDENNDNLTNKNFYLSNFDKRLFNKLLNFQEIHFHYSSFRCNSSTCFTSSYSRQLKGGGPLITKKLYTNV